LNEAFWSGNQIGRSGQLESDRYGSRLTEYMIDSFIVFCSHSTPLVHSNRLFFTNASYTDTDSDKKQNKELLNVENSALVFRISKSELVTMRNQTLLQQEGQSKL
jgi:hypothetical protein